MTIEHRIRWFARVEPCAEAPDGWLPRNVHMAGRDWGWDVRCSCGWKTRTGGAIQERVRERAQEHLQEVGERCSVCGKRRALTHVDALGDPLHGDGTRRHCDSCEGWLARRAAS